MKFRVNATIRLGNVPVSKVAKTIEADDIASAKEKAEVQLEEVVNIGIPGAKFEIVGVHPLEKRG